MIVKELVEKRSSNTKTFVLGKGLKRLVASIGDVHYKDNYADSGEAWKDIDLTWEGNRITKAPYELTIDNQKLTLKDKKTGDVSIIELLDSKPAGLKWEIIPEYSAVKFQHILSSDKIPFEARFKVTGKKPLRTRAFDDAGELEIETSLVDGILTERLLSVKDKLTGQARAASGSIRIDPTWQVGASSDDCLRWKGGWDGWFLTDGSQSAGGWYDPPAWGGGGMRFTNVTIPQGTIIYQAYLTLRSKDNMSGTVTRTRISAEKADNAPTFANDKVAFDNRWANRTTARVDWDGIPAWTSGVDYNSPEIKTVVQEVINRAGWASGNAIVIFWDDFDYRSNTYTQRIAYSYNGSTTYAPKLVVEYAEPEWEPSVLRPNAAGDETAIPIQYPASGAHWDKVDDVTPDEDATYVGTSDDSSTAVYRDLYNLPAVSGSVAINFITVYARARRSVAGSSYALGLDIRIGGITYSSGMKTINDSYADNSQVWETNPNTGAPWTWDDIDSLQIGCRLRTGDGAQPLYTRCTQVWVEIAPVPIPVADGDLIGVAVIRRS